jgi:cold shock CspA family protein
MKRGTITTIAPGYLFVEDEEGTKTFIHYSAFPPEPRFGAFRIGDEVEFGDIEQTHRNPCARSARVITVHEEQARYHVCGRVQNLCPAFGFVRPDDGTGTSYFFHRKDCRNVQFETLAIGDPVTFNLVFGKRGLQATDVGRLM